MNFRFITLFTLVTLACSASVALNAMKKEVIDLPGVRIIDETAMELVDAEEAVPAKESKKRTRGRGISVDPNDPDEPTEWEAFTAKHRDTKQFDERWYIKQARRKQKRLLKQALAEIEQPQEEIIKTYAVFLMITCTACGKDHELPKDISDAEIIQLAQQQDTWTCRDNSWDQKQTRCLKKRK